MNICVQCGKPQIVDGVEHVMLHYGTQSYHLDCLPYDVEAAHRADHGALIDKIKGDTGQDYAARRLWAQDHAAAKAAESGE